MNSPADKDFVIRAYRIKELCGLYQVTWKTWARWIEGIPDLGEYNGKLYTPAQVEKIINHLGKP